MEKIDKLNLDEQWIEWDKMCEDHHLDYANAVYAKDKFKNDELAPYLAELELEIRNDPERFGLKKVTDKAIEAALLHDDKAKELREQLMELERDINEATAVGFRLSHRAKALEFVSKLFFRDYYYAKDLTHGEELTEKLSQKRTEKEVEESLNSPEVVQEMKERTKPKLKLINTR